MRDPERFKRLAEQLAEELQHIQPRAEEPPRVYRHPSGRDTNGAARPGPEGRPLGLEIHNSDRGVSRRDRKDSRSNTVVFGDKWAMMFLILAVGIISFRLTYALLSQPNW